MYFFYLGHVTNPSVMFESSEIAVATVHFILVVVVIVGNSLVCAIVKKHRDMRYVPTKIYYSSIF